MQDVNPDMDEIFKEAADKYPLKTNTAEWEAISQKLHTKGNNDESDIAYKKRTSALLFLVLLIPTGLIVTQYIKVHQEQKQIIAKAENKQINALQREKAEDITSSKSEADKQRDNKIYPNINKPVSKEEYTAQRNNSKIAKQKELVEPLLRDYKVQVYDDPNKNLAHDNIAKDKSIMHFENDSNKLLERVQNLNILTEKNSGSSKNSKKVRKELKRFYIGGVIAPELTSVKFQPVKRMSFNLGILMGYRLNDKIGFQLGATFAHRYYYTDGKYTAPKSIRYDNAKILNVNAFSSVTEMPLTFQYNIKSKKNTRLFASAGCVSYVMHKEHYNYTYEKNGEEKHSVKYDNKASDYWFSNVQIGFGYEYNVNKIGNIVIEPYYRIPLKNTGISNLPITSIGINFALTKNLKN